MNLASAFKAEIARVARKETKSGNQALKKSSSQYRSDIAALKRRVGELERLVGHLSKGVARAKRVTNVTKDDPKLRFRSGGFATLREKLGLSAAEMGLILGVSGQSVYKWEQGKAKPRASQLLAIAAARKMGKKGAAARLAELSA